ncbi:MAG: phage holin family protein [Nocardiopsaceae bacterium]|nr:phage holin family protein [Nocardiopsaceae bacterium]
MSAAHVPPQKSEHGAHTIEDGTQDRSLGDLIGEVTQDLQKLFRQEVALAKAEIREEATKAGKAAGMLGGAGFAAYMVAVLLSLAAVFALDQWLGLGWSTLVIAAVWAVIGAVLFVMGRSRMRAVSKPEQTIETLKEDAQWARHPTR